jgi:hypothetical protein
MTAEPHMMFMLPNTQINRNVHDDHIMPHPWSFTEAPHGCYEEPCLTNSTVREAALGPVHIVFVASPALTGPPSWDNLVCQHGWK